jgi:hypothetical protein
MRPFEAAAQEIGHRQNAVLVAVLLETDHVYQREVIEVRDVGGQRH